VVTLTKVIDISLEDSNMEPASGLNLFVIEKTGPEVVEVFQGNINFEVIKGLRDKSIQVFHVAVPGRQNLACKVTRYDKPSLDSESWSGDVAPPGTSFTLILKQGRITLSVHASDRVYMIRPVASDQYKLIEIDPERLPI
jgi:hypothetical protein